MLLSFWRLPSARCRGVALHWIALCVVMTCLAALAAAPALESLQPVREVAVTAALPVADITEHSHAPDASRSTRRTVQAPGWLEPDPYFVAVPALADGVVARMLVLEGQQVESGQVIAELVADDARLARQRAEAELAAARAGLALAEAHLAAAQTDWDQPVERDRQVAATAAAWSEAAAELQQLPAMVEETEAQWQRWKQELQRLEDAFAKGAATERELIVARQETAARAAALESMRGRQPVLAARVLRLAAERDAAARAASLRVQERQTLDAAKVGLDAGRAEVALAEVRLAEASLRLERMVIRSPMAGLVLRRIKSPGDKVMAAMDDRHSAHLVHLYDPNSIQVRVDVPLADAAQVAIGQSCEVVVDVLPDQTFRGEVTRITNEADLQKNTLQVKVRVMEPSRWLKPEMLTRVRFVGAGPEDGRAGAAGGNRVRLSETCLDGDRVWVVRQRRGLRGVVTPTTVAVVDRAAGYVTVQADLQVGDLLVSQPAGLQGGERVQLQSMKGGEA